MHWVCPVLLDQFVYVPMRLLFPLWLFEIDQLGNDCLFFLGVVRVVHAIENPVVAIDDEVLILDHLHLVVSLIDRQSNPLNLFFSP